ncbi:co-chaperone GroES [Vaginisenegalia massiliensis]|uniref:co-chaperone GroES n=1 Tax=Vaginisenegalia massiliensis TaxID=2058294 RepID=UPI000F52E327|nr:co-chaperone GroES [Vaginisenegalia massiliensis]
MLKPIGERVVVEVEVKEAVTAGGLVLPSSAKEEQQTGKIMAIGSGVKEDVKVGDTVVFRSFAGSRVEYDGKEYLIADIEDIMAIID